MKKKNLVALMLGLTIGVSAANALAAEANEPDSTVDPAAFTDVPKDHWAYGALEILAKDGVLEGYSDGSFQGDKPMTRYEMAQIIVNAYNNRGGFADEALADGIRQELAPELKNMKKMQKQINKNASAIAQMRQLTDKLSIGGFAQVRYENNDAKGYSDQNDQDRYYLELNTKYKVNDKWNVNTSLEVNHRYANYRNHYGEVNRGIDPKNGIYFGAGRGDSKFMMRLWMEGQLNDKSTMEIGRKWRGLGFQNVAFGEESDGFTVNYKPKKDSDLTFTGFYMKPTKKDYDQLAIAGIGLKGNVGHGTQLQFNIAKTNTEINGTTVGYDEYGTPHDGNIKEHANLWSCGNTMYNISMLNNVAPNLFLWTDYSRTNADTDNRAFAAKLSYKWANLQDPGSFQLYLRYHNFGKNGRWVGDTNDNLLADGTFGWSIGGQYVLDKNVDAELAYVIAHNMSNGYWGPSGQITEPYTRNLIRGQVNFHF